MSDSAEVTFDPEQWETLLKKLRKKWKDIETRKEFAGIISATVFGDVMDHFAKEEGPKGKWQKWSDMYTAHMKKIGRATNKILQFNGHLRQSFQPTNWRAQPEGILFFNNAKTKPRAAKDDGATKGKKKKKAKAGGGFPYAAAHDQGGGKLPQRKFMWISDKAMVKIVELTETWLNADNKSGGG